MVLDLHDRTLNLDYLFKAKKICKQAIELFYIKEKSIFQKNVIATNNLFHKPIDISDGNIPNGNSIMLLNFSRLKMKKEAKELSDSLNGYLNVYKSLMASALKSIDYSNIINSNEKCTKEGCVIYKNE